MLRELGWSGTMAAAVLVSVGARAQMGPPIHGLAHVAYGVTDVGKSAAFYERLGFEEAFHFGEGAALSQVFLKVNDRQFIELYPKKAGATQSFLHLCFDVDAAEVLHDVYVRRGMTPIDVRKARAGNLLFTLAGPEGQNIEYTQYLPGSLHSNDAGKHLGPNRIGSELMAVGVAFANRDAARTFYLQSLSFEVTAGRPWLLNLPGPSRQEVLIEQQPERARLYLRVQSLEGAAAELKRRGVPTKEVPGALEVVDPDGNLIELESGQLAVAVGTAK